MRKKSERRQTRAIYIEEKSDDVITSSLDEPGSFKFPQPSLALSTKNLGTIRKVAVSPETTGFKIPDIT
jgi:hypothetical protein